MSNRHATPLDDDLDRWVDDPTVENASRLSAGSADGDRWLRWHQLLRSDGVDRGGDGPNHDDPDRANGRTVIDGSSLGLPTLSPRALQLAARAVVDAWRDPSLRGRLRADPRSVLTGAGVVLPDGVDAQAVTVPLTVAPRGAGTGVVLELPLPASTAPPADETSMRSQLRGTPHEWVVWAAFGPFESSAARPAIAALADVRRPRWTWRRWRQAAPGTVPARAWAFAGALAAVAVALFAAPGVLGPLAGAAIGPAQGVRIILALACVAGAALLLLSARRR